MSDNEKKVLYEYGLEKGHIEYDRIPETTRSVLGLKAAKDPGHFHAFTGTC